MRREPETILLESAGGSGRCRWQSWSGAPVALSAYCTGTAETLITPDGLPLVIKTFKLGCLQRYTVWCVLGDEEGSPLEPGSISRWVLVCPMLCPRARGGAIMLSNVSATVTELTRQGQFFAVVGVNGQQGSVRAFEHAPETLFDILENARQHGDLEFLVSAEKRLSFSAFFKDFFVKTQCNICILT